MSDITDIKVPGKYKTRGGHVAEIRYRYHFPVLGGIRYYGIVTINDSTTCTSTCHAVGWHSDGRWNGDPQEHEFDIVISSEEPKYVGCNCDFINTSFFEGPQARYECKYCGKKKP